MMSFASGSKQSMPMFADGKAEGDLGNKSRKLIGRCPQRMRFGPKGILLLHAGESLRHRPQEFPSSMHGSSVGAMLRTGFWRSRTVDRNLGAVYSVAGTLIHPPRMLGNFTVFFRSLGLRVGSPYLARKRAYSSERRRFSISLLMIRSHCRQLASGSMSAPFGASGTMCSS